MFYLVMPTLEIEATVWHIVYMTHFTATHSVDSVHCVRPLQTVAVHFYTWPGPACHIKALVQVQSGAVRCSQVQPGAARCSQVVPPDAVTWLRTWWHMVTLGDTCHQETALKQFTLAVYILYFIYIYLDSWSSWHTDVLGKNAMPTPPLLSHLGMHITFKLSASCGQLWA